MAFVGHVMKQNFETQLLVAAVNGKKGRGRPKTRYSDNIKENMNGRRLVEIFRMAQDRKLWRATTVQFEPSVR